MGNYEKILTELLNNDVDFILGGGVACVLHGVERVTMDVDIAVSTEPENFSKFLDVMKQLRLLPRVPINPQSLLNSDFLDHIIHEKNALVFTFVDPDQPTHQVDIFLRSEMSYSALSKHIDDFQFHGKMLKVVSKTKLLEIKLAIHPPRLKDQLDIEFLKKNA